MNIMNMWSGGQWRFSMNRGERRASNFELRTSNDGPFDVGRWVLNVGRSSGSCPLIRETVPAGPRTLLLGLLLVGLAATALVAQEAGAPLPRAYIDGVGPDWRALGGGDFTNVNCEAGTWTWSGDGVKCTGQPVGVIRSIQPFTNFELVVQWRHLQPGGNSGVFVWATEEALTGLKPGQLPPGGIEVQVLDHGYAEQYEREQGKKPDWFTTHGDVFPVGKSSMQPFPPVSPNGQRSFPRKNLSRGVGEWNHYYVRCLNGEVRLWVNGEEVSGGRDCRPSSGYLCLESEGAPVEFRRLRIRELP